MGTWYNAPLSVPVFALVIQQARPISMHFSIGSSLLVKIFSLCTLKSPFGSLSLRSFLPHHTPDVALVVLITNFFKGLSNMYYLSDE